MEFPTEDDVINCLRTVVDPEFPLVDIYTMGLIYNIKIKAKIEENKLQMGEKVKMDNVREVRCLESEPTNSHLASESQKLQGSAQHNVVIEETGERDDEWFVSYGDRGQIIIDMTLTTPACPAADYLPEQAKNSVQIMYPEFEVILNLVRDPTWTIAMIKDEDLKRMFE